MTTTLNASTAGAGGFIATSDNSGVLALQTAGTTAVTIDTSQNVGIGVTPTVKLDIAGTTKVNTTGGNSQLQVGDTASGTYSTLRMYGGSGKYNFQLGVQNNVNNAFEITPSTAAGGTTFSTPAMVIDSSGNLLVGTTNSSINTGVGFKFNYSATDSQMSIVMNTATSLQSQYHLYNTNATNNGYRFYVTVNGGIYNYSGNNSNLSDERTKKNIELSGNYLSKICSIPIKLFNYKDEAENEQKTLGVLAQDVAASAPELVNNEGFGDTPQDGIPLKSVYTTDMMFALMKSIQELKQINDTQAETINALTARVVALESRGIV
jgi:hypothetical protein